MSSAHVFQIGATAELKELSSFNRTHLGDRFAVDVDANLTSRSATVVNDVGDFYHGRFGQPLESVRTLGKDSPLEHDQFYRLSRSRIGENTFVLSADSLVNIDFRVSSSKLDPRLPY